MKIKKLSPLSKLKQKYFFAAVAIYMSFFLIAFTVLSIFLTILQAHPYLFLASAIILLLAGVLVTEKILNEHLKDYWIYK